MNIYNTDEIPLDKWVYVSDIQPLIQAAMYMVNTIDHNGPAQTAAGDLAVALAAVMTPEQYAAWKRSRPS